MGGKTPQLPNYALAAQQGVQSSLDTYPLTYLTNAAAQMGNKVTIGGQTYDFTGLGTADDNAVMSDQMAKTLLAIQQNNGPAFIQQSLDDLKQSDPAGYADRQQLFDKILADSKANPDRPMASDLQDSINSQLQTAGKLDNKTLSDVQQQVRGGQAARGNTLGNAATSQEADAAVQASDTLKNQQQATAQGFLSSGVTPEDVQYRRIQQSLSNLGAFQSGQTPTAQFSTLSSAGNTAAPFNGGPGVNPLTNPNAAQNGLNYQNQLYSGQVNFAQSQVNPYIAGLSTGISGLNAYNSLGGFQGAPGAPSMAGQNGIY